MSYRPSYNTIMVVWLLLRCSLETNKGCRFNARPLWFTHHHDFEQSVELQIVNVWMTGYLSAFVSMWASEWGLVTYSVILFSSLFLIVYAVMFNNHWYHWTHSHGCQTIINHQTGEILWCEVLSISLVCIYWLDYKWKNILLQWGKNKGHITNDCFFFWQLVGFTNFSYCILWSDCNNVLPTEQKRCKY